MFARNVFEGLESRTQYRYRLKCMNDFGSSAWSAVVTVSTTKKPQTSEDLQRAVTKGDVETVKNILPGKLHNQLFQHQAKQPSYCLWFVRLIKVFAFGKLR